MSGNIEIQCGSKGRYSANGELYFSTGQVYTFYHQLNHAYENLSGKVVFINEYDKTLEVKIEFDDKGRVLITGRYQEFTHENNVLIFEISSDQTYFFATIQELRTIVKKYGGLKGYNKYEYGESYE
ncbi:hypothetical protein SPFL3102_02161 [Sporomusaceae bacterium FL31]|nr:hypothetical protein SPFL3101_03795 [Sporomusaceae bacterium FL31]GCE34350.1 hypothetical protein SPFL3102_02161 [Sporomusaceae bacterium]